MRKNLTVKAIDARLPGRHNPARRAIAAVGAIKLSVARQIARAWLEQITPAIDPKAQLERKRRQASQKPELFEVGVSLRWSRDETAAFDMRVEAVPQLHPQVR